MGAGYLSVAGGLTGRLGGPLVWEAHGELGWHPTATADLFAFADGRGLIGGPIDVVAGVGARVRF